MISAASLGFPVGSVNALRPSDQPMAVVKGDTSASNFARPSRAIFVGTGGTVTVVLLDGTTTQFSAKDGAVLDVVAVRVNNTGSTATNMVAYA